MQAKQPRLEMFSPPIGKMYSFAQGPVEKGAHGAGIGAVTVTAAEKQRH